MGPQPGWKARDVRVLPDALAGRRGKHQGCEGEGRGQRGGLCERGAGVGTECGEGFFNVSSAVGEEAFRVLLSGSTLETGAGREPRGLWGV